MDQRENVCPDPNETRRMSVGEPSSKPPTRVWTLGMKKKTPLIEFEAHDSAGLKHMLRRAKILAAFCGLSAARQQRFGQRVLELARTACLPNSGCAVSFWLTPSELQEKSNESGRFCLVVDLWRLQSRTSHGQDVQDERQQGQGDDWERVFSGRLEQALPIDFAIPSALDLNLWREAIRQKSYEAALDTIYRRSKERFSLIAETRQNRPALAESEAPDADPETLFLLSLVASKTDNAIAILDAAGGIEWTNAAFSQVTGLSDQDACAQPVERILFPTGTPTRRLKQFRMALRNGKSLVEEGHHLSADGRETWTTFQLTPLQDEAGRLVRWIAIGTDTTKRRETEQALEAAKFAAESASRSKSEFLANISHEIRTPMNIIMGMSQLALADSESPRQREFLQAIQSSADLLLQVLNDVLDLSKIEAAKLELETRDVNLADLVRDTLISMSVAAEAKGLNLAWDFGHDIPQQLRGDGLRIRQVLVNLVGNAIKFTSQGKVHVAVQRVWENRGDVGLRFSVNDTGIGIPADRLERIFDAFTQADSSTTRQFGGTGLGLTITADLIRLMDGRIWVESEIGRGSTFSFELQLKKQRPGAEKAPPSLESQACFLARLSSPRSPLAEFCKQSAQPFLTLDWPSLCEKIVGAEEELTRVSALVLESLEPNLEFSKLANAAKMGGISLVHLIPVVPPNNFYLARQLWQELGGGQILVHPITLQSVSRALQESLRSHAVTPQSTDAKKCRPSEDVCDTSLNSAGACRVLVVDDHLPNRQLIVHALGRIGHSVIEAATGHQAIDLLASQQFDLVLMDVQMPELDGLETTRRIRGGATRQNTIPIVGVSAYALHGDRQRCLQAGMNDYLTKPIDVRELTKTVEFYSTQFGMRPPDIGKSEAARSGNDSVPLKNSSFRSPGQAPARFKTTPPSEGESCGPTSTQLVTRQFQATWDRLGQDEALFRRQLQFLNDEAPEMLNQLALASTELRFDTMAIYAHRLAGLLGTFDEQQGAELARRIESLSLTQSNRGVKALLEQLGKKIDKLLGACRGL